MDTCNAVVTYKLPYQQFLALLGYCLSEATVRWSLHALSLPLIGVGVPFRPSLVPIDSSSEGNEKSLGKLDEQLWVR